MTEVERRARLSAVLRRLADCNPESAYFADEVWKFVAETINDTVNEALDLCRVLRNHAQSRASNTPRREEREWCEGEVSAYEDAEHDIATLRVTP